MSVLGFLLLLIVAAIIGWLADLTVPGRLPYGWIGAIIAGLVGAWIGTALLGSFGPVVAGLASAVSLVSTFEHHLQVGGALLFTSAVLDCACKNRQRLSAAAGLR